MKIYRKIVMDAHTFEVLSEDYFEYVGEVTECKGGGGGSTTSVDTVYNDRMATIAEENQEFAKAYFDFWESDYKPLEAAQIAANAKLIPEQLLLQLETIDAQRALIPAEQELALANTASALGLVDKTAESTVAKLDLEIAQAEAATDITPEQKAVKLEELRNKKIALGGSGELVAETTAAARDLLPAQTEATKANLTAQTTSANQLVDSANINTADRVAEAGANVQQEVATASGATTRDFQRLGVGPERLANELADQRLGGAKASAAEKTKAARVAENEKFQRLAEINKLTKTS